MSDTANFAILSLPNLLGTSGLPVISADRYALRDLQGNLTGYSERDSPELDSFQFACRQFNVVADRFLETSPIQHVLRQGRKVDWRFHDQRWKDLRDHGRGGR
jgi:hypothetical protein